jgi:DNA (cytosine-5)-methyltransferase 1
MQIPIIDLFAGPGGLGEGFSSVVHSDVTPIFKIKLSIEKDEYAHCTLELRAFFRQFPPGDVPTEYYDYLEGHITRDQLFEMYPTQAEQASSEAWLVELGGKTNPNELVDARIRKALDGAANWILMGGPPCQAYSLAGRSRIRGENKDKYENDHRHFLYREYLRIIAVHRPPLFIMENVKGLLSAEVKKQRIFNQILLDLANPQIAFPDSLHDVESSDFSYRLFPLEKSQSDLLGNYSPKDFVVHSEKHGIPQARHRVIILGVRTDFEVKPSKLETSSPVCIEDAIGDLPKLRSGLSREPDSPEAWRKAVQQIVDTDWLANDESFADLRDSIISRARDVDADIGRGSEFIPGRTIPSIYHNWFEDSALHGICNHHSRGHIREDLNRYFFAAVFAQVRGYSPKLKDFPRDLLPNHQNIQEALTGSKFNDRFRVQLQGRPSTTVISHISKDGHYYIHYDPCQCRSLTVREVARLQTFPDNYYFEGSQTEQYKQVGNAVPPLLAHQIAEIVAGLFA